MAKVNRNLEDDAERELGQALMEMPPRDGPREICPKPDLLRRFVAGSVGEEATQNYILAHLDVCPRCADAVLQLSNRRTRIRRAAMALAAVVVIGAILWIWPIMPPPHSVPVAVVNLSIAAPTRGNHRIEIPPVKAAADTRHVRIVLPKVSAEGSYEIALFKSDANDKPLLQDTASPTMPDHNPEITANMDFSRIPPGGYLLGIRHGDSNWEYVSLVRE